MRYLKPLVLIPLALSLTACNEELIDSLPAYVPTGNEAGIYVNNDTPIAMFVDTSSNEFPVIIGDFDDGAIYATKEVVEPIPTIKTKGVISSSYLGWVADDTTEFTVQLSGEQADVMGVVEDTNVLYSLDKAPNAQSLTELSSGWVETASNSYWQIQDTGAFSITSSVADCTLVGTLTPQNGYYVSFDMQAENCDNTIYEGSYDQVRLGTFVQNEQQYVVAVFVREQAILWRTLRSELTN